MTRILAVDDNEENLYYLRVLLEGSGCVVESARHGAEALVMARKSPPDVIISDLLMPVMDGYTLLRHWKADTRLKDIPFIVYTATYTEEEDERLAMDLGADAFILKPCEPEDFIARIRGVQANAGAAKPALPHQPVGDESSLLKYYSETLIRKLESKTLQLEEANRAMQLELAERMAIEEELNFKNRILQTQQETSLDAILVVGENGEVLTFNRKFIELWGFTAQIIGTHVDELVLSFVADQIENTETFTAKVRYLYEHRDEESHDELQLKDGRIVDRYSAPISGEGGKYYGRIWYYRDVTEARLAQKSLQVHEYEQRQLALTLEAERARLVQAQNVAKLGSWETDLTSMAVIWSDQIYRIFETEPANFNGTHQDFLRYVHPEDRATVDEAFARSISQRSEGAFEHRLLLPNGRIKHVEERWQIVSDDTGKPVRAIGTCQDITERKETEARIIYLNRVYAVLSGINMLIVRVRDHNQLFNETCRIAIEAGGFRMAMLCITDTGTKEIVPCAHAGKSEELIAAVKALLSSNHAENSMLARAIAGKRAIVSNDSQNDLQVLLGDKYAKSGVHSMAVFPLIVSGVASGALALYAGEVDFFHREEIDLLNELTDDVAFAIDHIDQQEKLNFLAYHDGLTGLANRTLFLERLARFMQSAAGAGHKLALLLIDLERFKNLNDSLGRPTGDALLKQVAEWLRQNMGGEDLLARLDADHFAVVVPKVIQEGDLTKLFDKMSKTFLDHPFHLNDTVFRIAAKGGIALFPDDGSDVDILFNNAEAALKMAKKSGDRYLFHTRKMTEAVAGKLTLENQLRRAIDNEEFVLHYQPKVDLVSGKVTSAEALIRWNDPRTGLVPPGRFIPILEETGLIYDVGRWALRQAITDYLRWRAAGLAAVRIAVNVSPLQLRNPGFVAEIEQKIGVDAHASAGLELEITESMIMEDMRRNVMSLQAIRAMGVTVAIDDFGTGFSSLGYLAKLPADTLKIDRSFVVDMTSGPEGLALVSTIIDLGHALKFKVVAEGVETEEQSHLLRLLNCDEMQGYLFSKPVPAEDFEKRFLVPRQIPDGR